jgi:hypothetical protein
MIERFILEELVARHLSTVKIPPYRDFRSEMAGLAVSGYDLSGYSDSELRDMAVVNALGVPMQFPLYLKREGGPEWLLPYEPLIKISGKTTLVRKQVSKGQIRGTVKERWAQDDYAINISGILIGERQYPYDDVKRLRELCEEAKLLVRCPLLELFSINRIVVESYDIPFTAGLENQAYEISAYSDDIYKLLLRREDLKKI